MSKDKPLKIYIAGPMSGLPEFNYPAFHAAAAELRARRYEALSPAETPGDLNDPWEVWLKKALALLLTGDAVLMLDGWQASRGATIEHDLAGKLGMKRFYGMPE